MYSSSNKSTLTLEREHLRALKIVSLNFVAYVYVRFGEMFRVFKHKRLLWV